MSRPKGDTGTPHGVGNWVLDTQAYEGNEPRPEMSVYAEPAIKGSEGRTDKQTEDASDIGFYVWCAFVVVAVFTFAWALLWWVA